ncbi:hypothetical protein [Nocardiopsis nanhaiensis]
MATTTTDTRLRPVLNAPRGHRFSRPGSALRTEPRPTAPRPAQSRTESHTDRRERLLRQMQDNPRVAYMLEHGTVPHWVTVARQQREQAEREAERALVTDETREASEPQPESLSGPSPVFRPAARGRHRAPRRWWAWPALALSTALLMGNTAVETVGAAAVRTGALPL